MECGASKQLAPHPKLLLEYSRGKTMNCPTCNVQLSITDRQGVEIDYCPQCRGVWLDRGELDKIIERSASVSYESGEARRRDYNDDDYDHREGYGKPQEHARKRKGFLGELFDFD